MTCIVGLIDGRIMWMGGDRRGIQGEFILDLATPKVWYGEHGALIGTAGSGRCMQLARYGNAIPGQIGGNHDPYFELITVTIPALRAALSRGGWIKKQDEQENSESEFLVALKGRLFTIHGNFDVTQHALPYAAIGSGAETALGALFALNQVPLEESASLAQQRITIALAAAQTFQRGVAGPFDVLSREA